MAVTLKSQELYQIYASKLDTNEYLKEFGTISLKDTQCTLTFGNNYRGSIIVNELSYIEDVTDSGDPYVGWDGILIDSDGSNRVVLYIVYGDEFTVISVYFSDNTTVSFLTKRI